MKKAVKIISISVITLFTIMVISVISIYFITSGDHTLAKTVKDDSSIPHITIDDVTFHAETFGSDTNQTVIIIHGGPGNDYRYLLPLQKLSEKYHVVFYDQRGTGLSPRVDASEHTLANSLKDLGSIINYYSPDEKVYLIGHSWGAMLATGYISKNPDKVEKVVLAEPGMLTSEKAKEFAQKFDFDINWQFIKSTVRLTFEGIHLEEEGDQVITDYIFTNLTTLEVDGNPMTKYFCDEKINNGHIPLWRYSLTASSSIRNESLDDDGNIVIDLVSGLENYKNKVLFVVGECNQIIGEEYQKEHMEHFPNAEMKIIKGAGHTMFGEKTAESIEIINEYFGE